MRSKGTHDADVGSFGESESGNCDLWRQNKKINRVKRRTQKRNSVHRKKDNRWCGRIYSWFTATWKYRESQVCRNSGSTAKTSSRIKSRKLRDSSYSTEKLLWPRWKYLTEKSYWRNSAITSGHSLNAVKNFWMWKHLSFMNLHTYVTWWKRKKIFWMVLWLATQTLRFP